MAETTQTTILLIEDSPSDARLIKELLHGPSSDSFHVITASTLSQGREMLSANSVDVILLDLGLPDSQGIDTFRAVYDDASHLPIIILTVSDDELLGQQAVREGAQRFVSKDVLTLGASYAGIFTRMIRFTIEQKRTEVALKASEEQLQTLFEFSPTMQIRYDPEGYPVVANRAARAFLGIDDVRAIHPISIFASPRVGDADKARLKAGTPARYEQTYDFDQIRRQGVFPTSQSGVRSVDFSLAPIFDKEGAIEAYLAQAVDITERKHAEEALQHAHEEVQALNEELRTANEELEYRVQERTEELTAAATSLKESEARYRRLVERSFDAVIIHSDGVIRLANEAAARILKAASPADLVGRNILDIPTPRFRELAKGRISAVYKNKQSSQPAEFQYCALDGKTVDVEVMATPITYEDKPAVYVVFRDIGERKRSEEQARAAFLYARSLIEASLDPLVTINAKGRITDVNTATEETTGYSRDELIGSDFSDYFTEPEKARAGYKKVFTDGFVRDYPLAIRHKSGSVIDVLYNARVYRSEAGEVRGVFAAARDVSDLKRAEEKLQQYSSHLEDLVTERTARLAASEKQYRTLVETANSIILTMSTDGIVTFINDYGAHFFGYAPLELIGKDVIILVPEVESTGRPLEPHVRDILAHPDDYATNLNENITKDGRRVWVQWVNRRLVDVEGRYSGHLAVGIDVTTLKHTEAALKDAERLAAIGQTATMIGHDLRNPLQALQLLVDLAGTYYNDVPPELKERFDAATAERIFSSVEQQIKYMDKIVSDLQDYSRPLALQFEEVHLAAFVSNTLALLMIPESVRVNVKVADSGTARVDPHLMQRALSNLIMNAVQAMPSGGELIIRAAKEDGKAIITIHDTGAGISEDLKDKLFSPLTTGKAKGTGLGLAVVKRIVQAHNGTITFESEEGRGTTFTVTLPQTAG
ncbi:MAG: PAS domain S-box protein [Halobacteriota archaeon]